MQKSIWLMAAFLFSMFISGCGGGSSTSVIASGTTALTPSDVSNKTLFSTTVNSTKGYIAFQIYSTGSATWDSQVNRNSTPPGGKSGTWAITNGQLVLSVAGTPAYQFTCIQKEPNYWLVSDASNNITRMYFSRAVAEKYLNTIAIPNSPNITLGGAIQGTPLTTTFSNISTIAGTTGTGGFNNYTAAKSPPTLFGRPVGITTMDGKTFFVLDMGNNDILQLTPGTNGVATVTALKTSGNVIISFNSPSDITTDGTNLYVTDTYNYVIKKISPDITSPGAWISATLSGTGVAGAYDGTGNTLSTTGNGTVVTTGTARFAGPIGITTDGTNLYVVDDGAIRKVDIVTGNVTTLAGSPGQSGSIDATGTTARFNQPLRITTDGNNLYVTDYGNYTIRKVSIATGQVTTIAGSPGNFGTVQPDTKGNSGETGDQARFNGPNGITTDGTNLYVTDWGPVIYGAPVRGQVIFRIALANPTITSPPSQYSGPVTRIAGTQDTIATGANQPSTSNPNAALFDCPIGLTTDGASLYVVDTDNYTIRRIY